MDGWTDGRTDGRTICQSLNAVRGLSPLVSQGLHDTTSAIFSSRSIADVSSIVENLSLS